MDTEFDALGSPAGFVSKCCSDNSGDLLIDVASISSLGESTKTSLNETAKTSLGAESSLGDTTKTSLGETSLGAESCFGETILRKRFVPVKSEDDNTPLPSPFPLPKHYRSDVELALHTGKMIKDSMSGISVICGLCNVGFQKISN